MNNKGEIKNLEEHTKKIRSQWNEKFNKKRFIWGKEESLFAKKVIESLKNYPESNKFYILDIGCGYGRDMNYFVKKGFKFIEGIDISSTAVSLGRSIFPHLTFYTGDFINFNFKRKYNVVYCNFLLHLFIFKEIRINFLKRCAKILEEPGIIYFSVSSIYDSDFRKGEIIGKNLVKNKRGVIKFFYDDEKIKEEFSPYFKEIRYETFKEKHYHDFFHIHINYFVTGRKR